MTWHPIDFQGITNFERVLKEQVQLYLEEEQTRLSGLIANILPHNIELSSPVLPAANLPAQLSSGVESFALKMNQVKKNSTTEFIPAQKIAENINQAAQEYADSLKESSTQLFSQLDQVGIQRWSPDLLKVVQGIKDLLFHHMEDLKWALKRLESLLREYQKNAPTQNLLQRFSTKIRALNESHIDQKLVKEISKTQKNLGTNYQEFLKHYEQYVNLNSQIDQKMAKFSSYQVLNNLDKEEQENYKNVYRLLQLWKRNKQEKILPENELISTLRFAIYPEKISNLFKHYYTALEKQLFSQSRTIKEHSKEFSFTSNPTIATIRLLELKGSVINNRFELHTLGATISNYRSFLLETDPNPYVRTRGGFSEWIIGHEPTQTKSLVDQEFNIERLDKLYLKFHDSLPEIGKEQPKQKNLELYNQIEGTLHTIGQPLATYETIASRSIKLTEELEGLNELNSRDPEVVDRMNNYLSTAMRADWRYNSLHGVPLFHQIYNTHVHLLPLIIDRNHFNRSRHFRKILQQIHKWVQEKQTLLHLHQIELDINDMKGYLQDFLAQQQRVSGDSSLFNKEKGEQVIGQFSHQLLEYRYLFGNFFHQLHENEAVEKNLREQFLFVDYYFDTIETKLSYMKRELDYLRQISNDSPLPESKNFPPEGSDNHP